METQSTCMPRAWYCSAALLQANSAAAAIAALTSMT